MTVLTYTDMLGIKIKDKFLSLYTNTVLQFEMSHPMSLLHDGVDKLSGGYSFPVNIPLDDTNLNIIGHVNRLDNHGTLMSEEPCEIWLHGLRLPFDALATIKEATNNSASLYIVINPMKLFNELRMPDVDYGGDRDFGANGSEKLAHILDTMANPLDYDYVFAPVFNPKFNEFNGLWMPSDWEDSIKWQNPYDMSSEGIGFGGRLRALTPFPRTDYLLDRIFKHEGYTLINNWITTDELRLLLLWNNYSLTYPEPAGFFAYNIRFDDKLNLAKCVPDRLAIDFLKAVTGTFCLGIFPDSDTKSIEIIPYRDLILNAEVHDWTPKAARAYAYDTDHKFITQWQYDLDPLDDHSHTFSGLSDVPEGSAPVWPIDIPYVHYMHSSFFPVLGLLHYVKSENSYYICNSDLSEGLQVPFNIQLHKQILKEQGPNYERYISKLIPMWSSWGLKEDLTFDPNYDNHDILVPTISHTAAIGRGGNSPTITFRTMLYRGFQKANFPLGDEKEYPFAGVTEYNIRGEQVGDHSLLWDGPNGIFEKYWRLPYEMMKTGKVVRRQLNLDLRDIINFSFKHKIRIENQNYFITKLRLSLSSRGIGLTDAEMITTF